MSSKSVERGIHQGMSQYKEDIYPLWYYLTYNEYPPGMDANQKRLLRKQKQRHVLKDGQLFTITNRKPRRIVCSSEEALDMIEKCHVTIGKHSGIIKTRQLVSDKFYWPNITRDVKQYISACPICNPGRKVKSKSLQIKEELEDSHSNDLEEGVILSPAWEQTTEIMLPQLMQKQNTVKGNNVPELDGQVPFPPVKKEKAAKEKSIPMVKVIVLSAPVKKQGTSEENSIAKLEVRALSSPMKKQRTSEENSVPELEGSALSSPVKKQRTSEENSVLELEGSVLSSPVKKQKTAEEKAGNALSSPLRKQRTSEENSGPELEGTVLPSPVKKQKTPENKSKYNNTLEEFFVITDTEKGDCICLICERHLTFRKNSLKNHFITYHKEFHEKYRRNVTTRRKKFAMLKQGHQQAEQEGSKEAPLLHALLHAEDDHFERTIAITSIKLSWKLAQANKPYSDTSFIKECALMMVEGLASKKEQKIIEKINNTPFSPDTAAVQVTSCVGNVNEQLREFLQGAYAFGLAVDISTKIRDISQCCIFIRAVNESGELVEDLLDIHPLEGRTCGSNILDAVLNTCGKFHIPLDKIYSVTTDGSPAMLGNQDGFVALFQQQGDTCEDVLFYHSLVHQEHLASMCSLESSVLKEIMEDVFFIVDFLHKHASQHEQFKVILEDFDVHYGDLVHHTEVPWLSKGQVLNHFFDMLIPITDYLKIQEKLPLKIKAALDKMEVNEWVEKLAFLVDITNHLNALKQQLQAKDKAICDLYQVIYAFSSKMKLLKNHLTQPSPVLTHFARLHKTQWPLKHTHVYVKCLELLQSEFTDRFSEIHNKRILFTLMLNPFLLEEDELRKCVPYISVTNLAAAQLELIDLKTDDILIRSHKTCESPLKFWQKTSHQATLKRVALIGFSMFGSTHCFEKAFNVLSSVKNKYFSQLTETHSTELVKAAVTEFTPNFDEMASRIEISA